MVLLFGASGLVASRRKNVLDSSGSGEGILPKRKIGGCIAVAYLQT